MPEQPDFRIASYQSHAGYFAKSAQSAEKRRIFETWFDDTTADAWRHARMYEAAELLASPDERWLTIGDGRYGLDSIRIAKRGVRHVLPTDISDTLLEEARAAGKIADYRVENAETLSFADSSFDYVFIKEALHHCPRPFLAIYEMLRVARKGVIIVEPSEPSESLARRAIFWVRWLLGRQRHFQETRYEPTGNYAYAISELDLEKVCLGMDLPQLAVKRISDIHVKGLEFEKPNLNSSKYLKVRGIILANDLLSAVGLSARNRIMACIFKEPLDEAARQRFSEKGWRVTDLPRNPYLGAGARGTLSPTDAILHG
ncbi:MAG TPA: class I SAM-dependent methyltransferase [Alphaproteobacteria bacterium]|nr:class I SAM-dependent methyltransferase [Alphaproteobacteria bacterium]